MAVGKVVKSALKNAEDLVSVSGVSAIRQTRGAIDTTAKKAAKTIESKASSTYQSKLNAVHEKMISGIHSGSDNIVDVIEKNTGVAVPRKANGRRDVKSARESANVFNQSSNKEAIDLNNRLADSKLKKMRKEDADIKKALRKEEQTANAEINRQKKAEGKIQAANNAKANEEFYTWADENGFDIMDDEQLKVARVTKMRQEKLAAQREAMKDYDDIYDKVGYKNFMRTNSDKTNSHRKVTEKNSIFAQEYGSDNVKATGYDSKTATDDALTNNAKYKEKVVIERGKKNRQPETSPSGGNASIIQQAQDKIKGNNFVYNMAALGVGGGLVLNMANNKGQQSNAQLYGQY